MKSVTGKSNRRALLWGGVVLLTVVLDQFTKFLAVRLLQPVDTVPIIRDVLHLTYVTNRGAAFGMLKDHRWVFLVVSTVAIVLLGYYLYLKREESPLFCTALAFIVGGGIGNMIDRIMLGYVVDFVDFRLIHFAVFNTADSFVCVGCAMVFLWVLFSPEAKEQPAEQTSGEEQPHDSDR